MTHNVTGRGREPGWAEVVWGGGLCWPELAEGNAREALHQDRALGAPVSRTLLLTRCWPCLGYGPPAPSAEATRWLSGRSGVWRARAEGAGGWRWA